MRTRNNSVKDFKESLGWEVERHTPFTQSQSGLYVPEDKYVALKRSDTLETLSLFRNSYTETKNRTFEEHARQLADASGYELEGFAEFRGGTKVLAYLKATDDLVHQYLGLKSENYLVFGNSHDGTTPLFVGSVNILLRCYNQWGRVMQGLKVRHTKNHNYKVDMFIDLVRGFRAEKEQEAIIFQKMSEIKIDRSILDALANRLLNIDEKKIKEGDILSSVTARNKISLMDSLNKETSDLGMNLWGVFNGITHYTTHSKTSTDTYGNLLGGNMKFNQQGLDLCVEVAQKQGIILA
jgi:hypothetical protein